MTGSQGRNSSSSLEADTEAETIWECCSLCFAWLGLALLYSIAQAHLWAGGRGRGGTTYSRLIFPMSITNGENTLRTCLQARLIQAFSQFLFPFPDGPSFVKLTESYQHVFLKSFCTALLTGCICFMDVLKSSNDKNLF